MGISQILMIILITFSLTVSLARHGEQIENNFWANIIVWGIIIWGIIITLLITGGFF